METAVSINLIELTELTEAMDHIKELKERTYDRFTPLLQELLEKYSMGLSYEIHPRCSLVEREIEVSGMKKSLSDLMKKESCFLDITLMDNHKNLVTLRYSHINPSWIDIRCQIGTFSYKWEFDSDEYAVQFASHLLAGSYGGLKL